MKNLTTNHRTGVHFILLFLLFNYISYAQIIQVEILGGSVVAENSTIAINAGNSLGFRITNIETNNCSKLKIQDIDLSNTLDFDISPNNPSGNIKPIQCNGGNKFLDFELSNTSSLCASVSTQIIIDIKNEPSFVFTLVVNSSPEMHVIGGSPWADIIHGDLETSDNNGTYFGEVDAEDTVSRTYVITNVGSCPLDITALSSTNPDFVVSSSYSIPSNDVEPYDYIAIQVTFTAPIAGTGTQTSTISIDNTDNTTFTFNVNAEMFNVNIPGPGGVTADFRLWLKSTRGITSSASKVSFWQDLGTNDKSAEQTVLANQPTYLDDINSNINFNPVIKFENDEEGGLEQYLYNSNNGFYSHDIFIVMSPDATMTKTSLRQTIFAGIASGDVGDITGIGFGDYSTDFTNETLSYNQNTSASFNGTAELNSSYTNAGIINVRNDAASVTKQELLYNSNLLTTTPVADVAFANVNNGNGSRYWIGRNYDIQGSLNGRVAEIFTFASRLTDANRQKVESYLAIKYGATLGNANQAQKDYVNSFDSKIWDVIANSGFNYDVAGIGRDSISDLNQKQSKTINLINDVTIGLGGLFTKNSLNTNEFIKDGDFLVWGNNNASYSGTNSNLITIASGLTTSVTRIDRKWKIVETQEVASEGVETVYIGIPDSAFNSFVKSADEEYVLIVADNENFSNTDIIDVIPLKINLDFLGNPLLDKDGNQVYKTWYNFDGTKFFTFGKAPKLSEDHSVSIGAGDYLVGESDLNLNVDSFTISSWVKCSSNLSTRTIMSKGTKLQLRLNGSGNVEVMIDDSITPKFTSNMIVDDGKWHQVTFVYDSGTILLYVDGILDKSVQNIVHPSPNYNNFAIGSVYIDKVNVINPLLGKIDEVYVWDLALSENQIHYLMNQEIERYDDTGVDYVNGKILPQASSSNETAIIPWSSLRVYYNFNSFFGSTVEGLTDDRLFLRLKYLDKNKSIVDSQTIPVPYVTAIDDGNWDDESTWVNGSDNVLPNALGLDGSPIDWNIVETLHDINSGDRDITLLGLVNTVGTITIADPNEILDETNSGQGLIITHYLELDGAIDLVGESQLIQTEGSVLDADSGGYIERDQQGTANGFNYNYWSSSVGPISGDIATKGTGISSNNSNFLISEVLSDGTISSASETINFSSSYSAADSDTPTTPRTLSTYWMYAFYGADDDYDSWASIDELSSLMTGEGFTMKGTSGSAEIDSTFQNYVFKGQPNNGDFTLPLVKNVTLDNPLGDVDRLIGNPYPSAMDATEFILDNISVAEGGHNTNGTIFNGALYFWDHFGESNSHYLNEYIGGYAVRNLLGGVAAIADDNRINNTSEAGGPATGTKIPGQYIPVNQGFFVSTLMENLPNGTGSTISSVDGGDIVFKNSQRIFERENVMSSVFMRTSLELDENAQNQTNRNSIIRLMYDSPRGYHRQIVLGTDNNATNDFDLGYDAYIADVNIEDVYWTFAGGKFVIQGVNSFDEAQVLPLGLKISEEGFATLKIQELVNVPETIQIFVHDLDNDIYHDLKNNNYTVYLTPGEYLNRFEITFSNPSTLSNGGLLEENSNIQVYFSNLKKSIIVHNPDFENIKSLEMFNILGQSILKLTDKSLLDNTEFKVYHLSAGSYIIKVETLNGTISKKVLVI